MSRSMVPSQSQLEKLADMLDRHQYLATGHARTAQARNRTRAGWQDVANTLNSEGNGCIKTGQQWAKYWKDKKAALKKKVSQRHQARLRTGGGATEEVQLSALEERLVALVGGEGFAIGDRELDINPFAPQNASDSESIQQTPPPVDRNSPLLLEINNELPSQASHSNNSESLLQVSSYPFLPAQAESMVVQAGTAVMNEMQLPVQATPEPQPGPSGRLDFQRQIIENMELNQPAMESSGQRRHATSAASSPRRHRMTQARRRLLQRTPPAQRNSQLSSLTDRFIAIEERRVEVEMLHAQALQTLAQSFDRSSQAFLQQGQALQALADSINIFLQRTNIQ